MFTVCHYTAPTLKQLPVTGCYEMKVSFIPIVYRLPGLSCKGQYISIYTLPKKKCNIQHFFPNMTFLKRIA